MLKKLNQVEFDNIGKGPIRRSLFSNGASLIFHHAEGFSGCSVKLNFLSGSMFEKENEYGLAHLIEHLLFKETKSDLIKKIEQLGAELNAYTGKENVCFEMSCLARNLEELLPLFFEVFFKLEFDADQLMKEKLIVIQELTEDKDDHETQGLETVFLKNFYIEIGHPVGGSIADVKKYNVEDVSKYYRKYFTPDRLNLTIVSGHNHKNIEKLFVQGLSLGYVFKDKAPFRLRSGKRNKPISHFKSVRKRKMESAISYFSFDGPVLNSSMAYDFAVLDELLFEGLSSRYFKRFREDEALVYGIGSSVNSFADCGNYIMVFNSRNAHINAIKKGVFEVLTEMATIGPSEEDIIAIKRRIINLWELSFDDIDERAEYLTENEMYNMQDFGIKDIFEKIQKVSSASIKNLVKNSLLKNKYSELVLLSKD